MQDPGANFDVAEETTEASSPIITNAVNLISDTINAIKNAVASYYANGGTYVGSPDTEESNPPVEVSDIYGTQTVNGEEISYGMEGYDYGESDYSSEDAYIDSLPENEYDDNGNPIEGTWLWDTTSTNFPDLKDYDYVVNANGRWSRYGHEPNDSDPEAPVVEEQSHPQYASSYVAPPPPRMVTVNKYGYYFGIDRLNIKRNSINKTCCYITKEVYTGDSHIGDYIQIESDYIDNEYSSIEFYIIDGPNTIAIAPINNATINNEKIFYGLSTRFTIDITKPITIRRNGSIVDISVDKAISLNDAEYTISYTPLNACNYTPIDNKLKIKIIERLYNTSKELPYIKSLTIKKFGGDTLWKQNI